jgi:ribosomal protein L7/L12
MKLLITPAEVRELFSKTYGVPASCVEIVTEEPHPFVKGVREAIRLFPTQKIEAIKYLRQYVREHAGIGLGLPEAKYTVERPAEAIEKFERTGQFLQS